MYSIKDENRFWTKIERDDENPDKCWNVVDMCLTKAGYGEFSIKGKRILAHRFSYQLFHNRLIKDNMCICHKCDNPSCVNPNHLWEGTVKDNNNDRDNKGRAKGGGVKGEKHHSCKLTEKQVKEIREKYAKGGTTHRQLAKEYSVSRQSIGDIINRKIWTHI
jgi:hypothetical protein